MGRCDTDVRKGRTRVLGKLKGLMRMRKEILALERLLKEHCFTVLVPFIISYYIIYIYILYYILYPEVGGSRFPHKICDVLLDHTASLPRKL
jgi:hypothetical protein